MALVRHAAVFLCFYSAAVSAMLRRNEHLVAIRRIGKVEGVKVVWGTGQLWVKGVRLFNDLNTHRLGLEPLRRSVCKTGRQLDESRDGWTDCER